MSEQAYAGLKRTWHFNKQTYGCHDYCLEFFSWRSWAFTDGCLGVHAGTPWGAFVGWLRWRNIPLTPEDTA